MGNFKCCVNSTASSAHQNKRPLLPSRLAGATSVSPPRKIGVRTHVCGSTRHCTDHGKGPAFRSLPSAPYEDLGLRREFITGHCASQSSEIRRAAHGATLGNHSRYRTSHALHATLPTSPQFTIPSIEEALYMTRLRCFGIRQMLRVSATVMETTTSSLIENSPCGR